MVNHVDPCSPFSGSVALGELLNSQSLMCMMGSISWRFLVGLLTARAPRRTGREPALNKGQLLLGLLLLRWSLAVVRVSLHLSSLLGACGWWGQGLPGCTWKLWAEGRRSYFQWILVLFVALSWPKLRGSFGQSKPGTEGGVSSYSRDGRQRRRAGEEPEGRCPSSPMVPSAMPPSILSLPISPLPSLGGNLEGAIGLFKVDLVSNTKRSISLINTVFLTSRIDFLRLKWDSHPQAELCGFIKT